MGRVRDIAREIAGPEASIKRHGLFNPIYEVTAKPSLFGRIYKAAAKPLIMDAVSLGLILGSESICTNTAIAEEAKIKPPAPTTRLPTISRSPRN